MTRPTVADRSETELVALIQSTLPSPPPWVMLGIGDDAAVVEPERNRLDVITVDAVIDGVHVDRRFTPAGAIGHRALAANLSDLAAMGASPRVAVLSLALPPLLFCDELEELARGMASLAARHRIHVVGGNLARTPGPLVVDITAIGSVRRRDVLTRAGARPGDDVYVSEHLGLAAAGLAQLRDQDAQAPTRIAHRDEDSSERCETAVERFLYPEPRVRLGRLLARNRAATACIDLSDGLADGVRRIAAASGVGIVIDRESVPLTADTRAWFARSEPDPVLPAIVGGDDYELLFTVRPRLRGRLRAVARHCGTALTRIGTCTTDGRVLLRIAADASPIEVPMPHGYEHFSVFRSR